MAGAGRVFHTCWELVGGRLEPSPEPRACSPGCAACKPGLVQLLMSS